jgi:methionyl-tRNA formyltransferase
MNTVVAFLAREHGLNGLQALLNSTRYRLLALATHRLLPKSEDIHRSERVEFAEYCALAKRYEIPLFTIDHMSEQQKFEEYLHPLTFDLIASISWRRLIPSTILCQAKLGGVNLHRGKLPQYPGAEPIKQALLNGDSSISISAHILTDIIDGGRVLYDYQHMVSEGLKELPLDKKIACLKQELTPYFGPLLIQAMDEIILRAIPAVPGFPGIQSEGHLTHLAPYQ